MGFAGTVTLRETTLLSVLMDTVESLSRHGIKRFLVVNIHGGNTHIVNLFMQRAKREFKVMMAAPSGPSDTEIGRLHRDRQKRHWDVHSGPTETGTALHLFPDLVEMWRLEGWKATLSMDPEVMGFLDPDREDHELVSQLFRACTEPDTHNFTASGVYGKNDPREANPEEAKARFEEKVNFLVQFIKAWKRIPLPPAFQDQSLGTEERVP
jgi:creatinine amidohydrolase/Fe(II)-dependent formamide hydrolase-like protein